MAGMPCQRVVNSLTMTLVYMKNREKGEEVRGGEGEECRGRLYREGASMKRGIRPASKAKHMCNISVNRFLMTAAVQRPRICLTNA